MKSGRRIAALAAFAMVTMVALVAAPPDVSAEYLFQSSNSANTLTGAPHVDLVSAEPGNVTLRFSTNEAGFAFIEYRIDGVTIPNTFPNPVTGDPLQKYVCVEMDHYPAYCTGEAVSVEKSFSAQEKVEVRLAWTSNPDWSFDWTAFTVDTPEESTGSEPSAPPTKLDCKKGRWADFGFSNQGHCVSSVMTSKVRR